MHVVRSRTTESILGGNCLGGRMFAELVPYSSEEAWTGTKLNLSHVRAFGTKTMVFIPKPKQRIRRSTSALLYTIQYLRTSSSSQEVTFINESKRESNEAKQEVCRTMLQQDIEEVVSLSPEESPLQPQ